jgi:hypothetical protein
VLEYWHSAQADRLTDALRVAVARHDALFDVKAEWPSREMSGLRIRVPEASPVEWMIHEVTLYCGGDAVADSPHWQLHAWPNAWELPLAFDGNLATRWRSLEPIRAGMYVEADFDRTETLSGAVVTSPTPLPPEFYGRGRDGWQLLTSRPVVTQRPPDDLRTAATRAIRGAGFRYILADTGNEGIGVFGAAMLGHEAEWGLEKTAELGGIVLFRIR